MTETEQAAVARLRAATGLVGGCFAVVTPEGTRTECFGWADRESGRPVTELSFFDIASNSKAFTAMLGAIAAEEGRFDWDAPVRALAPDFGMTDAYAAAHLTPRDLGCHRSGLARHEFMRARVYTSIADMAQRTRYMEFDRGFRESYRYNNQGFIVLGWLLEQALGAPWRDLIRGRIAAPLGMEMRFRGRDCDFSGLDCALPYRMDGRGGACRCDYADNHVAGPCGGIRTNLLGMTAWLRCLLADGAPLCGAKAFRALLETNVPTGDGGGAELCCGYGLGWRTSAYRGRFLVSHGGSIQGFNSHVAFFPGTKTGFVILLNTSSTWSAAMLRDTLLDELCGAPPRDLGPEIAEWRAAMSGGSETRALAAAGRAPTAAELRTYGGRFFHPAYDDFTVAAAAEGGARLDYGIFHAPLRLLDDGTALACEDDAAPDWMRLRPREGGLWVKTSDLDLWLPFDRI